MLADALSKKTAPKELLQNVLSEEIRTSVLNKT